MYSDADKHDPSIDMLNLLIPTILLTRDSYSHMQGTTSSSIYKMSSIADEECLKLGSGHYLVTYVII